MKTCNKCKVKKNKSEFYRDKNAKNGIRSICKNCDIIKAKSWNRVNSEKHKEHQIKYRENNRQKTRDQRYRYASSEKGKKAINNYFKNRYNNDLNFKILHRLRVRLNHAIKNNQKTGSAVQDLGCSIAEFKAYIESLWQEGMSWDNWAKDGWHIDHIEPLCRFDLTSSEDIKKACHYTNLRPMWAEDNLSKGGKYE